eukprot:3522395-Pyramimonas_sp.AAC.1
MSKVALSEQQHKILDADRAATMRAYVTAAAKRAAVVREDDLPPETDIHANPEKASKAHYTQLKTWFDNKCFKVQDISKASNIATSRRAHKWKLARKTKKNENARWRAPSDYA